MLGASHPSIPARCARRPPPLGLPPSHGSPNPRQSPSPAPTPRRAAERGRGARALPGRPGREGAGGGGSGARRLGRGRAGTAGEGRRKRRRARAITAGIINNRKKNNHRRVERERPGGSGRGGGVCRGRSCRPQHRPRPHGRERGRTPTQRTQSLVFSRGLQSTHWQNPRTPEYPSVPSKPSPTASRHCQVFNIPMPWSCSTSDIPKPLLAVP